MKTAILSVIYYEPDWFQTCVCIARAAKACPVYFVDRAGIGGLSEAFNRGFVDNVLEAYEYVWFLTNITFGQDVLPMLIAHMDRTGYAAMTPTFDSDHAHTRTCRANIVKEAPFVEFTAPLVRTSVFRDIMLDDKMPYSGHDLDWGYRVRQAGFKVGVFHGVSIGHTYIRFNHTPNASTLRRKELRAANEGPTKDLLAKKWGPDWPKKLRANY